MQARVKRTVQIGVQVQPLGVDSTPNLVVMRMMVGKLKTERKSVIKSGLL